jgi:hypothetical protein
MDGLTQLGGLLLVIALTVGPVVGLLALLNYRDGRESRLLGAVLKHFVRPEVRGRIAIRVRSAVLSPRSVVAIDMRACSRDEVWDAIARLSRSLPSSVHLVVDGTVAPQSPATFVVKTGTPRPPGCPARPSVVPG